jgi:hypothetical protein
MSHSFKGIPKVSIFFFILCSIGDKITQLSESEKLQLELDYLT